MNKNYSEKHLLTIKDPKNESVINLGAITCSIGRDPNNMIVLNYPQISRHHATLLRITTSGSNNYQFRIIDGDLNGRRSSNGIKVNNKACLSYDLQDGDVITFNNNLTAVYQTIHELKDNLDVPIQQNSFFDELDEDIEDTTQFLGKLNSSPIENYLQTSCTSKEEQQILVQQSLERLASFPELCSEPIIEIDFKGNITYLNPAALETFPQLTIDKLQHPVLANIVACARTKEKTASTREITIGEKIFEQFTHIISESQLIRCYVSDITKRKKAEILLKKTQQELEARVKERTLELAYNNEMLMAEIAEREQTEQEIRLLQTISQAISEAPNFDEAIAIILNQVCRTVGWSFGEAWIPDNLANVLRLSLSHCNSEEKHKYFREASEKFAFPADVGMPGRVWASKHSEWSQDVSIQSEKLFLRSKIASESGLRAALGVPIIADGNVIAVLVFFDCSALTENKQTVELITSVAAQLGLIMERKRAEDALRSSMATNKAILNAIPDLIFRINKAGIFVNYKAAKHENLLTPETKFLGKHLYSVFPEEISQPTMNCIERAFETGEVQILECKVENQDKTHHYEVRIAVTEVDEVIAIIRDITDRKQAEEDICKTLEQQQKLNELKSRFVTMASHEFRTPLASILSSSELIEHYSHKWSEEKKLSHLSRIQASVKHMTELLNDVLLLGKSEAGKLELNPSKINLAQFCQDLIEEVQITSQTHQIIYQIKSCLKANNDQNQKSEVGNDEPDFMVVMDVKILRHIISNLLSNAIKYSPDSDKVKFELTCQDKQATFRVQDFGIGIPISEQNQLFDSFHRANNVGSIPGTGLGLPIVKRSVDLCGGKIYFCSEVDVGSTFTISLPYLNY